MSRFGKVLTAAAVLAGALGVSTAHAGPVLDRVLATNTLTVAAGTDWAPMSFLNNKNELDGFDVEIAKGIAERMGVKIKFVTPGWEIITAGKWNGRWDLAMGQMLPTKKRAETFSFPAVYIYERGIAVVHKDNKATKLSELNGKVAGVSANTAFEMYANQTLKLDWAGGKPVEYQFKPSKVKSFASTNIAFDDLRVGDGVRLDVVISDETQVQNAIKSGYPIKQLGGPLYYAPDAIATLLGDKEFDEKIAAAIKSMREDGTLSKLAIKWYGTDLTVKK